MDALDEMEIMQKIRRLLAVSVLTLVCFALNANAEVTPASASTTYWTEIPDYWVLPVLQTTTPVPGSTHVPNDFDGNGTSDLIWYNIYKSQLGFWMMSARVPGAEGGGVERVGSRVINITPGYFVGAVGDLDGDGYADLVFTSDNNDLWLWTNSRQGAFVSRRIYDYPREWRLIGAGDVNGDGRDDLLWTNPNECLFAYWLMRGGERIGSKVISVDCGYYPGGIGYYTPSNRISILWMNLDDDLYIWDSTGADFRSYHLSPYIDLHHAWTIGGGFAGRGIGVESWSGDGILTPHMGHGELYDRVFDAQGRQTDVRKVTTTWSGPIDPDYQPGAFVLSAHESGLYFMKSDWGPLQTGGLAGSNPATSGNAPDLRIGIQWYLPNDGSWRAVGGHGYWMAAPIPIPHPLLTGAGSLIGR